MPEKGAIEGSEAWPSVWVWSHQIKDGAGQATDHFDLISQDTWPEMFLT